jgi:SAM-dependent methyltransferase
MWRANAGNSEREKYQRMWGCGHYRTTSPGENLVPVFLELLDEPPSSLIDFGCGPGRASVALQTAGFEVLALDFTDNSRDADTRHVPFLEWDITKPIPASARWGYCTDVLEHLPPGDVDAAITNIMTSVETAFVQVACVHDNYGAIIGQILHLTVEPHAAWRARFERLGYAVSYDVNDTDQRSQFIITRV